MFEAPKSKIGSDGKVWLASVFQAEQALTLDDPYEGGSQMEASQALACERASAMITESAV